MWCQQQSAKNLRRPGYANFSPLTLRGKRGSPNSHKQLQISHNSFEATGLENIRLDLAFNGIGSINWGNLVAMGERLHKSQLQQVQQETDHNTCWVGEPAWDDDFKGVAGNYAKKLHYRMEWAYFGGQTVAHIPDELWWAGSQQQCC